MTASTISHTGAVSRRSAPRFAATGGWPVSAASTRSTQITRSDQGPGRAAPQHRISSLIAHIELDRVAVRPAGGDRLHHHVLDASSGGQRAGQLPGDSRRAHHADMKHDEPPPSRRRTMCPTPIIQAACLLAGAELAMVAAVLAINTGDKSAALAARQRLAPLLAGISDPFLRAICQLAMAWTLPITGDFDGALREGGLLRSRTGRLFTSPDRG